MYAAVLVLLIALSIGLIINFILINRSPKRTNYNDFYQDLRARSLNRLKEQRPKTRDCTLLSQIEFWNILNPLITRSKGSYFNFISLLKDALIRKDPEFLIQFDNTFLAIIEPYCDSVNFTIAKRLFPEDEWFFLLYMSFLISRGEQRFNWLATYPDELFNNGFEVNSDLSISGVCGHCYYFSTHAFMPGQNCFLQEEPKLLSNDEFMQLKPTIFQILSQTDN